MFHIMIIFKFKQVQQNNFDSIPPNCGFGCSDTGLMKSELFSKDIANISHIQRRDKIYYNIFYQIYYN